MRTTLTIIIAVALSLAIGVMTASAQAGIPACTNNKGTQYNLLTPGSNCKSSQVPTTFTVPGAGSAVVLSDTEYLVFSGEFGEEGEGVSCDIYDIGNNRIPSKRKADLGFTVDCSGGWIQSIDDGGTTLNAMCGYDMGEEIYPSLRIGCTIAND